MRKIYIMFCLILGIILVGCSMSEDNDDVQVQLYSSNIVENSITNDGTVSAENSNETVIENNSDESSNTCTVYSIESYEEHPMNIVNNAKVDGAEDDVIALLSIYEEQLAEIMSPINDAQLGRWNVLRYEVFDIDCDSIPELMLCYGNSHVDNIYIFSIRGGNMNMYYWGAYGSFGNISIDTEHKLIISTYGGQGYYYRIFSREWEIAKIGLENGRGDYYSIVIPTGWNGSMGQLVDGEYIKKDGLTAIDDCYKVSISEEEYHKQFDISDDYKKIDYSNMLPLYSEE